MLKLLYVIFMNLHRAPYIIPKMRAEADHPHQYTEEQRYSLVQHAIYLMNKTGKINTVETGIENLPKQGGIQTIRANMMCLALCIPISFHVLL